MRPVSYVRAQSPQDAVKLATIDAPSHVTASVQLLAGGTQLLDLAKLDVMHPEQFVDITRITDPTMTSIEVTPKGVRIGALVTMRAVAEHLEIIKDYPVVSESMWKGASQQIRNMGRVGGNVLQRTRCSYFRDVQWKCNKRQPGTGCDALEGINRWHAVLGVSDQCIASYPGDWAISLIALDATVDVLGASGMRTIAFADLHREPGTAPHVETTLKPGELITSIFIPAGPWTKRSTYTKVRDRDSYEFGLATVAVALDLDGEVVRNVRLGLGGPVAKPWRLTRVEQALIGQPLDEQTATAAADLAFENAQPRTHNAFRIPLGKATIVRALMTAKELQV
jgi:xanthine dehydrogenase YagS FAD-binding subunit